MDDSLRAAYLLDKELIESSRKNPLVLEISGNSQTIIDFWRKGISRGDYKYLKLNVSGAGVQSFGYCLFYWLIGLTIIFFFPIFLFASDCIKRRMYMLFNINHDVYEAIANIITTINPSECYIVVQDNYFNQSKSRLLLQALQHSGTKKIEFINTVNGFDIQGKNYSEFSKYMKDLAMGKGSKCRWDNKSARSQ